MADPYLRKLDEFGPLELLEVDGQAIRDVVDPQFTNFGHHYSYAYIPENELWLDKATKEEERPFFITHLLVERRLMAAGKSYGEANAAGGRAEKSERERTEGKKYESATACEPRNKLWATINGGELTIWIVNAQLIRDCYQVEHWSGTNGAVASFCPENEEWIDDDQEDIEKLLAVAHETGEWFCIKVLGMGYAAAHREMTKLEYVLRHDPTLILPTLRQMGVDI